MSNIGFEGWSHCLLYDYASCIKMDVFTAARSICSQMVTPMALFLEYISSTLNGVCRVNPFVTTRVTSIE